VLLDEDFPQNLQDEEKVDDSPGDPNTKLCYCQVPFKKDRKLWIGCDHGDQCSGHKWYHLTCLKGLERTDARVVLDADEAELAEKTWFCGVCRAREAAAAAAPAAIPAPSAPVAPISAPPRRAFAQGRDAAQPVVSFAALAASATAKQKAQNKTAFSSRSAPASKPIAAARGAPAADPIVAAPDAAANPAPNLVVAAPDAAANPIAAAPNLVVAAPDAVANPIVAAPSPISAAPAALPDPDAKQGLAADEDQQFWDQTFRQTIRRNDHLALRRAQDFNFARFERTRAVIELEDVPAEDIALIGRLLACFAVDMNERFEQNWEYLEAFTVFDPRPRVRVRNRAMVRPFLITLLRRYKMPAVRALEFDSSTVISHGQNFYALTSEEEGYAYDEESTPLGPYFRSLFDHRADIKAFAYFAVFCLRIFLVTVSCEALFNIMKLRQNKSNSSLSDSKLDSAFIFQNATRSVDEDFGLFYQQLQRWRQKPSPVLRGIYSSTNDKRARLSAVQTGNGIDRSRLPMDISRRRAAARQFKKEQRVQEMAQPAKARAHGLPKTVPVMPRSARQPQLECRSGVLGLVFDLYSKRNHRSSS